MASIYKDLVAFEDEIILEIEDALPGFPTNRQRRVRSEVEQLRAERNRLCHGLRFWESDAQPSSEREGAGASPAATRRTSGAG